MVRSAQVPWTVDTLRVPLSAKRTLCIELVRDTSNLFCKLTEFINHSIDDILDLDHESTLHGDGDLTGQVTAGDGITDANDVANLSLHETKLVNGINILVSFKWGITEWSGTRGVPDDEKVSREVVTSKVDRGGDRLP